MDIHNELIIVFNTPPIIHPDTSRLKLNDSRCVNRYNYALDAMCEKELVYYRMDELHQSVSDPISEHQQK